ncbi:MAG: hypothetical protein E7580_00165 [Ruminococcaceae bacterium]|nr:hypothetical protein [Oscillospiraceae bacterium]
MKKLQRTLLVLSIFFAAAMLFFTFFNFAWHSDAKGFQYGWGSPIGFQKGTLSTVADCVWTAAPFLLLLSSVFFFFGEGAKRIGTVFSCLPLSVYALLRFPDLMKEDVHHTLAFTVLGILFVGVFTMVFAFMPETKKIAPAVAFTYIGLEILFLILSFSFQEKYSYFYFQVNTLIFDRTMIFRYRFFVISTFFYYIFYALSLGLRMICLPEKAAKETDASAIQPEPVKAEEENKSDPEENEEEDYSSLTLEDLGIQR